MIDAKLLFNAHPVCPHCGHEDLDAWEIGDGEEGDFETACGSCEKPYAVSRYRTDTYSTREIDHAD